jgi:hypothetical protein
MQWSDFPATFLKGVPLWVPLPPLRFLMAEGAAGISWFPCPEFPCVHEAYDSAELYGFSRFRPRPFCLPLRLTASALRSKRFRSSILSPHVPLSTLRIPSRDVLRKTRGQDGSLLLSCMTLSFTTQGRFSPAHQTIVFCRLLEWAFGPRNPTQKRRLWGRQSCLRTRFQRVQPPVRRPAFSNLPTARSLALPSHYGT